MGWGLSDSKKQSTDEASCEGFREEQEEILSLDAPNHNPPSTAAISIQHLEVTSHLGVWGPADAW